MRSLQGQLLAAVGLLALAAVLGVSLAARHGARRELLGYVELERRGSRDEVINALQSLATANPSGISAGLLQSAAAHLGPRGAALLVDTRGRLVAATGAPLRGRLVRTRQRHGELVVAITAGGAAHELEEQLHLRGGLPARLADGSAGTLIPLLLPSPQEDRQAAAALGALDRRLLAVTAAAALVALLLTAAVARGVLAPVRQLQEATRDLARGRLERRVAAAGPSEIAELGHAFNGMAAELQRERQRQRDLVNDVAHELRTPLTAMLCRLDAVREDLDDHPAETLAGFHRDVEHLAHLVEDLQDLALADAGQLRLARVPVSLHAAASAALRDCGLAEDGRVRLEVDPELAVLADPLRLRQVLANLLTNAARYTPVDGKIQLTAAAHGAGEVRVTVADDGPGLTAEELTQVFERFWRADPARHSVTGGSGLGLAIVRTLVEAHGGHVWVESEPQRGALFGFSLPAATASIGLAGSPSAVASAGPSAPSPLDRDRWPSTR